MPLKWSHSSLVIMNAARLAVEMAKKTTANRAQTEAMNLDTREGNPLFGPLVILSCSFLQRNAPY
jgi:hypothetical protein